MLLWMQNNAGKVAQLVSQSVEEVGTSRISGTENGANASAPVVNSELIVVYEVKNANNRSGLLLKALAP